MGWNKAVMTMIAGMTLLGVYEASALGYSVDDKMKLEQWYASQATSVAENIVGKGKIVSFVHVYLETVQSQKAKDVYSINGAVRKTTDRSAVVWQDEARKTQQYLLPGFPVDEAGGGQLPGRYEHISEQQFELPQTVIKRMDVQMMVDAHVKDERVQELPDIIATTLSMSKERGDTIEIRKIPFPAAPGFLDQFRKPELIMDVARLAVHTVVIIMGVLLLYSVLRIVARTHLRQQAGSLPGKDEARRDVLNATVNIKPGEMAAHENPETLPSAGGPAVPALAAPVQATQDRRHFAFVNKTNLPRLAWLLHNEEAENIAMTLSYLDPIDSHFILSTIDPDKKNTVLQLLTQTFDMDPEKVAGWETLVRRKIDYVLSGPEMLMGMLDSLDEAERDRLLEDIAARDSKLAGNLREGMFLFEHIGYLEEKDIRQLLRNVSNEQLAAALQGMPDELVQKILLTRTEGGQTILKETMALSQKLPQKQVQEARHTVVRLARQMIKDGIITHNKPTKVDAYIV